MIVIRDSQIKQLDAGWRHGYIARLCGYLREQFADELHTLPDGVLHARVSKALRRAASYGIHSERDCCRFLNLAVFYGWDFGQSDATAWMHRILSDPDISAPAARLHALVAQCIYRTQVAENNARVNAQFADTAGR